MVPLLYSIIDFDSSPKTYERYDRMSARKLFQMCASRTPTSASYLGGALHQDWDEGLMCIG